MVDKFWNFFSWERGRARGSRASARAMSDALTKDASRASTGTVCLHAPPPAEDPPPAPPFSHSSPPRSPSSRHLTPGW